MKRRGLWLLAGAVLGVLGYRRAQRMGQALTGDSTRALTGKQSALLPALGSSLARRRAPDSPRRPAAGVTERAVGAAKFVRDVRAGMSEYRSRHRDPAGSTLGSQDRDESQSRQHRQAL